MVFITVRFGANESSLFNKDCRSVTLLQAIRERCCQAEDFSAAIELSDKEGNVKDLRKFPQMMAKKVLLDREDCVLLKVGENEKGKIMYTPLLENDEIVTKAFLEKLAKGSKRETAASGKSKHQQQQHQQQQHATSAASKRAAAAAAAAEAAGSGSQSSMGKKAQQLRKK